MSFMDTAQVLGNLGEFVGAIVIIATLIYLSIQVRQNSELIRVSAVASSAQLSNSMVATISNSRENAEYWIKGDSEFESLDRVDQIRLMFHESIAIGVWYHSFELRKKNLISDERWSRLKWEIQLMAQRQSVQATWQWIKPGFDAEFQEFMSANLESANH